MKGVFVRYRIAIVLAALAITIGWGVVLSKKPLRPTTSEVAVSKPVGLENTPPAIIDARLSTLVDRNTPMDQRIPADIVARLPRIANAADMIALVTVLRDTNDSD